jgi:phage tail protein X
VWLVRAAYLGILILAIAGGVWFIFPGEEERRPSAIGLESPDLQASGKAEVTGQREATPPQEAPAAPVEPPAPEEKAVREERDAAMQKPVEKIVQEKMVLKDEEDPGRHVIPPPLMEPERPQGTVVVVVPGDTVAQLAADYYGRFDSEILRAVKQANPDIRNVDLIYEGQKIFLPQVNIAPQVIYSVSVASYHSMNEAKAVFLDLIGKGYQATIYPYLDDNRNTWYRITIGTFMARQDAIDYSRELLDKGFFYAKPVKVSTEE